jgi:1-acyl-sn-glycerol-3-phosphate acyltransferase
MIQLLLPLFALNTLLLAVVGFYGVWLAQWLVPIKPWRALCQRGLLWLSIRWTLWNTALFGLGGFAPVASVAPGIELRTDKRYLIVSNHQTWTDILVLQAVFHPRVPFLTFFLKKQLLYVPIFGLIWWALGFPYMERYSAAKVARNPALKNRDLETTRGFCRRIRGRPYSIINFVEGTRRTPAKAKGSPFRHLLAPKAGGIATALHALEYEFDHVLDVTIRYGHERMSFVDLLSGRVGSVQVDVSEIPLAEIPRGDYFTDPAFAETFRAWLNDAWRRKDERFAAMAAPARKAG